MFALGASLVFVGCGAEPVCGDGVVEGQEVCDDGNEAGGDGCLYCQQSPGYTCAPGASCEPVCGDGRVVEAEVCDPSAPGYAEYCSSDCATMIASCGDGELQASAEICDDGNADNFDGCTAQCDESFGFRCSETTGVCDASSVPGTAVGNALTSAERTTLCAWFIGELGGANRVVRCGSIDYTINTVSGCASQVSTALGTCTVAGFERWLASKGSACGVLQTGDNRLCL